MRFNKEMIGPHHLARANPANIIALASENCRENFASWGPILSSHDVDVSDATISLEDYIQRFFLDIACGQPESSVHPLQTRKKQNLDL